MYMPASAGFDPHLVTVGEYAPGQQALEGCPADKVLGPGPVREMPQHRKGEGRKPVPGPEQSEQGAQIIVHSKFKAGIMAVAGHGLPGSQPVGMPATSEVSKVLVHTITLSRPVVGTYHVVADHQPAAGPQACTCVGQGGLQVRAVDQTFKGYNKVLGWQAGERGRIGIVALHQPDCTIEAPLCNKMLPKPGLLSGNGQAGDPQSHGMPVSCRQVRAYIPPCPKTPGQEHAGATYAAAEIKYVPGTGFPGLLQHEARDVLRSLGRGGHSGSPDAAVYGKTLATLTGGQKASGVAVIVPSDRLPGRIVGSFHHGIRRLLHPGPLWQTLWHGLCGAAS
jgi:hypothetical protein